MELKDKVDIHEHMEQEAQWQVHHLEHQEYQEYQEAKDQALPTLDIKANDK